MGFLEKNQASRPEGLLCLHCGARHQRSLHKPHTYKPQCPVCGKIFGISSLEAYWLSDECFLQLSQPLEPGLLLSNKQLFYQINRQHAQPVSHQHTGLGPMLGLLVSLTLVLLVLGSVHLQGQTVPGLFWAIFVGAWLVTSIMIRPVAERKWLPTLRQSSFEGFLESWKNAHGSAAYLTEETPYEPLQVQAILYCDNLEMCLFLKQCAQSRQWPCLVQGPAQAKDPISTDLLSPYSHLPILGLHDANWQGLYFIEDLRSRSAETARIQDLGLNPAEVLQTKVSFYGHAEKAPPFPVALKRALQLPAAEVAFLNQWQISLAALPPEELLQRIEKALAGL